MITLRYFSITLYLQGVPQLKFASLNLPYPQTLHKHICYLQMLQVYHLKNLTTNTRSTALISGRYPRVREALQTEEMFQVIRL